MNDEPKEAEENEGTEEVAALPQEEAAPPSLEEELAATKDQLLRAHAEMENLRKRMMREMDRVRLAALEPLARDLLSVLDNMRRAAHLLREKEIDQAIREGIELIFTSAETMLEQHQIKRVAALGEKFDPNCHEALFEDNSSEAEAGIITQVIEEGYRLGERLLRPARVGVAAAKEQKTAPLSEENAPPSPHIKKPNGDIL